MNKKAMPTRQRTDSYGSSIGSSKMKFTAQCPHCQARLEVESRLSGQPVSCPKCHKQFVCPNPPAPDTGVAGNPPAAVGSKPQPPARRRPQVPQNPLGASTAGDPLQPVPPAKPAPVAHQPAPVSPGEPDSDDSQQELLAVVKKIRHGTQAIRFTLLAILVTMWLVILVHLILAEQAEKEQRRRLDELRHRLGQATSSARP